MTMPGFATFDVKAILHDARILLLNPASIVTRSFVQTLVDTLADAQHWRERHARDSKAFGQSSVEDWDRARSLESENARLREALSDAAQSLDVASRWENNEDGAQSRDELRPWLMSRASVARRAIVAPVAPVADVHVAVAPEAVAEVLAAEPDHCPACNSPAPHLHPAMQYEGEVELCRHPFHLRVTPENTSEKIAARRSDR
jgi:hypothetical protein